MSLLLSLPLSLSLSLFSFSFSVCSANHRLSISSRLWSACYITHKVEDGCVAIVMTSAGAGSSGGGGGLSLTMSHARPH